MNTTRDKENDLFDNPGVKQNLTAGTPRYPKQERWICRECSVPCTIETTRHHEGDPWRANRCVVDDLITAIWKPVELLQDMQQVED